MKLANTFGDSNPQVLVRDGNTVSYSARIAGHHRVKQATKWKHLDPETAEKNLKANPGFIEKHRGKVGNDEREKSICLMMYGQQKLTSCVLKEAVEKEPLLAHNSPDQITFCEAVKIIWKQLIAQIP